MYYNESMHMNKYSRARGHAFDKSSTAVWHSGGAFSLTPGAKYCPATFDTMRIKSNEEILRRCYTPYAVYKSDNLLLHSAESETSAYEQINQSISPYLPRSISLCCCSFTLSLSLSLFLATRHCPFLSCG